MAGATPTTKYSFLDENAQSIIGQPSQPFGFTIGQNTDLASVSSFILFILLAVNGIAAILRVFYGLWLRTVNSNNDAKLTAANNIITNSLLSLFLSFSIVLLFMFVNPDVVTGGLNLSGVVVNKNNNTPSASATPAIPSGQATGGNEAAVRKIFSDAKIGINKDPCPTSSSKDCTDVGGLQQYIITAVIKLKTKCACDITITGGSEKAGHEPTSNHYTGNAVDIRMTSQLQAFFKNPINNSLTVENTPPCHIKYAFAGLIFWDEAPECGTVKGERHYHASVTGR